MRPIIASTLAVVCVLAAMPLAQAASPTTAVFGAVVAGQVSGNQGTTTKATTSTVDQGYGVGSSASGTNFTLGAANGSGVKFSTYGTGSSGVSVTPFSVTTTSSHSADAAGYASPGASFSATNQTFGQSNGYGSFNVEQNVTQKSYQDSNYKVVGAAGFVGYEGGFAQ